MMISNVIPLREKERSIYCLKLLIYLGILLLFVGIGMTVVTSQLRDRKNSSIRDIGTKFIIIGFMILVITAIILIKNNIHCNKDNENQQQNTSDITSDLSAPVDRGTLQNLYVTYAYTQPPHLISSQMTYDDPPPPYESVCQIQTRQELHMQQANNK